MNTVFALFFNGLQKFQIFKLFDFFQFFFILKMKSSIKNENECLLFM